MIDLLDTETGIEIKNRNKRYNAQWTFDEKQRTHYRRDNPTQTLVWAFILYELSMPIRRIRRGRITFLERQMQHRNVWFLPWSTFDKAEVHPGQKYDYIYTRLKEFPSYTQFREYTTPDGAKLYLPEGKEGDHLEERLRRAKSTSSSSSSLPSGLRLLGSSGRPAYSRRNHPQ